MSDERVEELQRELRERLKADLAELKAGQSSIIARLDIMSEKFAKREEMDDNNARLAKLENAFSKIVGGLVVFQIIGGFIMAAVIKWLK